MTGSHRQQGITPHLIDTHAHLDDPKYEDDRDIIVQRAAKAGVIRIIAVGADLLSSRAAVALSRRVPGVYAAVGVHPHDARSVNQAALDELRELATHPCVVSIGEIGLDFYRDLSPRDAQRAAFEAQLALATEVSKPVVIHIRDQRGETGAYDEALAILRSWTSNSLPPQPPNHPTIQPPGHPATKPPNLGVLHCFSGDLCVARAALRLGFYIGVDGPVTYPGAKALQALIGQLPLERLLLETDCPYLAPQPRRGRRNEPAYLPFIAQRVAELKGTDVQDVARVTTASAVRLFHLPGVDA